MFDTAFMLLNDRSRRGDPECLADALLLFNQSQRPRATSSGTAWQDELGLNAATSAVLFESIESKVRADIEDQADSMDRRSAIAEFLLEEHQVLGGPKAGDPDGWVRFALDRERKWQGDKCYHGTSMTNFVPILRSGLRCPKQDQVTHGAARGQGIYCSPSWHYSAHPVYSPLHKGAGWPTNAEAFQFLFECRVRRGGYTVHNGTLATKHWDRNVRIDPDRDTVEGLEYLIPDANDVQLTGILFRKFGHEIDDQIYGPLPKKLSVPATHRAWTGRGRNEGIEFKWTGLLQSEYRQQGLLLKRPARE